MISELSENGTLYLKFKTGIDVDLFKMLLHSDKHTEDYLLVDSSIEQKYNYELYIYSCRQVEITLAKIKAFIDECMK